METSRKKYDIIYADPPWQYRVWSKKGAGRSAESHYQTQSLPFLKNFNIDSLSNRDSVLLMWATFPCLQQALELGTAWGFIYKTIAFTWVKTNKNNNKLFTGMGYYTRANAEVVLLFTKGRPLARKAKNVPQVLVAHRGKHSRKPDVIRQRIVALFGDIPRVELFARNSNDESLFQGWDVFGNEVENSIQINNQSA